MKDLRLIDWFSPSSEKLPHGDDFRVGPKSDRKPRDNIVFDRPATGPRLKVEMHLKSSPQVRQDKSFFGIFQMDTIDCVVLPQTAFETDACGELANS